MTEELDNILCNENRSTATKPDIDLAFNQATKSDKDFIDWENRLKPPNLDKKGFVFCRDLLTYIAHHEKSSLKDIYNFGIKYNVRDEYMNLLTMLMNDGYLVSEGGNYYFLSELLKVWWIKRHPIFEIE